jgi:hypothetical protein
MSHIRDIKLVGHCPICGESTLYAKPGGLIHCANAECANRVAVTAILGEHETEHIVTLNDDAMTWVFNKETGYDEQVSPGVFYGSFTIRHPLRERVELADLADCTLHPRLSRNHPGEAGTYRVTPTSRVHNADPDPDDPLAELGPKRGDTVHDWTWERIA